MLKYQNRPQLMPESVLKILKLSSLEGCKSQSRLSLTTEAYDKGQKRQEVSGTSVIDANVRATLRRYFNYRKHPTFLNSEGKKEH